MSNTKTEHTPGPWKHRPYQYAGAAQSVSIVIVDANEAHYGCVIANVSAPNHHDGYIPARMAQERIANARLIAAAPDLYDALSRVGDVLEIWEAEGSLTNAEDNLVKTTAEAVALASCIRAALAKARGESKKS